MDDAQFPGGDLIEHADDADQRVSVQAVVRTEWQEHSFLKTDGCNEPCPSSRAQA